MRQVGKHFYNGEKAEQKQSDISTWGIRGT